ncbi:MarR family transcriptional regulator [Natronobacterium texcoconense]|uniref:MarR family transcriptional regulator n=1 Tax=Natronobacterium texcoconense TaxID=1095778 RepID=UPI000B8805EC|nr:MarR family transcriptional regulator [Natronobacterium texcoconense]
MVGCPDRSLLAALDEHGPVRVTSLASELDAHPITVTQRCDDLRSDGYVRRMSADTYTLTEDGREYLLTLTE